MVEELLEAGVTLHLAVVSSSLEDTGRGRQLRGRLEAATEVREVADGALRELADTASPQGVLVVAEAPRASFPETVPGHGSVVLVLDGVQDPGNVGTLARSAAAFGCSGMICLPGTVDPWNPKAVRASAGALFRLPVILAPPADLDEWLGRHEYLLAAADAAGAPVAEQSLPRRVALAVGNEGAGLSDPIRARADRRVAVPMRGGAESLNVAVAAAILLYELTKERA